jgi:diguanylate cyclase (GGDEF)-like protein
VKTLQEREQRFRYLASHDALTGALNRQSFFERAAVEFGVALGQNKGCCLAILDLDHFKAFNDRYGHLAGDEALKQVVRVLPAYLRREDFMGRYGGEEFVLFFRDTELGVCQRVCSRVLQKLASMPLALGGKEAVYITASMGVATARREDFEGGGVPDAGVIVQKMLIRADAALYDPTNRGRNRVISK